MYTYVYVLQVGAVNCEVEKELCAEHGLQSYPTIKAVVGGVITPFQVTPTTLLSTLLHTTVRHVLIAASQPPAVSECAAAMLRLHRFFDCTGSLKLPSVFSEILNSYSSSAQWRELNCGAIAVCSFDFSTCCMCASSCTV
jgi:hypothetical protein